MVILIVGKKMNRRKSSIIWDFFFASIMDYFDKTSILCEGKVSCVGLDIRSFNQKLVCELVILIIFG
jgi:hypothetical protein